MALSAPSRETTTLPPPPGTMPFLATTNVLEAVLYRGELPRADLPASSTRAPLHRAFAAALASRWMGLFPERTT